MSARTQRMPALGVFILVLLLTGCSSDDERPALPPTSATSPGDAGGRPAVSPRPPGDLAEHGIVVADPTGEPAVPAGRVVRRIKYYMARQSRLDPAAELYDVTITARERRTRVGGVPLKEPVEGRLAWVVTVPWRFYAMGGDPFSTAGRREQHVAIVDARTGRLLALDIIDARGWFKQ